MQRFPEGSGAAGLSATDNHLTIIMRFNRATTALAATMLLASIAAGCASSTSTPAIVVRPTDPPCGTYKGHQLFLGPKGGCYYIESKGGKKYIGHEFCDCDEKREREDR